jgi:hypothetical protein
VLNGALVCLEHTAMIKATYEGRNRQAGLNVWDEGEELDIVIAHVWWMKF